VAEASNFVTEALEGTVQTEEYSLRVSEVQRDAAIEEEKVCAQMEVASWLAIVA